MASPTTSKRESAMLDVVSTLVAVAAGSSYNRTVDLVKRVDGPFFVWLDELGGDVETAMFVEVGATSYTPETHGGIHLATVEVFIEAATRWEPDSDSALEMTTAKDTIRNELIADAAKALLADGTRGGNARETRVTDDGPVQLDGFNENGQWTPAGWVAHELRFEVDYELDEATP